MQNIILYAVTILLVVLSFLKDRKKTKKSLMKAWKAFENILPQFLGIIILIVMVFGGFALTGGALGPVLEALPHEMLIIGGAAVGALVTGNSLHGLKAIGGGIGTSVNPIEIYGAGT